MKRKRPRFPSFVSLFSVGYLQSLRFSVELEFPGVMWEAPAWVLSLLSPPGELEGSSEAQTRTAAPPGTR